MPQRLKIALIQVHADSDKSANLAKAEQFIREACSKNKPDLIALPEVFQLRGLSVDGKSGAEELKNGNESFDLITKLAKELSVSIMAGSILEDAKDHKPLNTAFYVNAEGKMISRYSKIHLFDVQIENFPQESDKRGFGPLEKSNLQIFQDNFHSEAENIELNMAMSICYDLRFPELYRQLMFKSSQEHKPDIIFAASAFSKPTGEAHWEVLLRARAIENTVFMIAPNQVGKSNNGFDCYGHSMIVDPWGRVIAEGSAEKEEIIYAELDLEQISRVRKSLPLENARLI